MAIVVTDYGIVLLVTHIFQEIQQIPPVFEYRFLSRLFRIALWLTFAYKIWMGFLLPFSLDKCVKTPLEKYTLPYYTCYIRLPTSRQTGGQTQHTERTYVRTKRATSS